MLKTLSSYNALHGVLPQVEFRLGPYALLVGIRNADLVLYAFSALPPSIESENLCSLKPYNQRKTTINKLEKKSVYVWFLIVNSVYQ